MQSRAISVVRARWLLGLAAVVAATLSVSLLQSTGGAATAPAASAPATAEVAAGAELGFAVQLGPEQRVTGPTDQGDNPYFSWKTNEDPLK